MNRTIALGMLLVVGCGDANVDDERAYEALLGVMTQGDQQAASECSCFYHDLGYATYGACLVTEQGGALTAAEDDCVHAATAGHGDWAPFLECQLQAEVSLSACLHSAQCTDAAFDGCYARYDTGMTSCGTMAPCSGLTGSALTQCQTEASLFVSAGQACFQ